MKQNRSRFITGFIAVGLILAVPFADAATEAVTVSKAELKKNPKRKAEVIATLGADAPIEVLGRKGGWYQASTASGTGWVKLSLVKLATAEPQREKSNAGVALMNVARTGKSSQTVATGIRGLDEEDLKSAVANPKEVEKLKQYSVNAEKAREFGKQGKLKTLELAYFPPPKSHLAGKASSGLSNVKAKFKKGDDAEPSDDAAPKKKTTLGGLKSKFLGGKKKEDETSASSAEPEKKEGGLGALKKKIKLFGKGKESDG